MKPAKTKTARPPAHALRQRSIASRALFLSDDTSVEVPVDVLARDDETVLFVQEHPDWGGPYLIKGKRIQGFFAGHDEDSGAVVRWAILGDVYVGIWFEHNDEYLFSFRLPKRQGQ